MRLLYENIKIGKVRQISAALTGISFSLRKKKGLLAPVKEDRIVERD
jgi:hypothetical protein